MARTKITISLIKDGINKIEDIVRIDKCMHQSFGEKGDFYYNYSTPRPALWTKGFFADLLQNGEHLCNTYTQGLLVIKRHIVDEDKFFAISFGYGRNLLKTNVINNRFGLITTLNSVDEKQLRSLDINTLESIPKIDRVQSSRLTNMQEFDIDEERDLLRCVTGKTLLELQNHFGNTVTGSSSLTISTDRDINTIGDLLDICYSQFQMSTYQVHFDWIDTMLPVKDNQLVDLLDSKLMAKINDRNLDTVWMAIPIVLDWSNQFSIHLGKRNYTTDDIIISDVLEKIYDDRTNIELSELKSKRVTICNEGDAKIGSWNYYDCLYGEIEYQNKYYILNDGNWYSVQDDYKQQVLDYYNNADISPKGLLIDSTIEETEKDYNERLSNNSDAYILMDRKLVPSGVSRNNIELCDVYSKDRFLIHIKKGHSSSVLSHLFNQGYVSGELLTQLPFRINVNRKLDAIYGQIPNIGEWKFPEVHSFDASKYTIIYGIITENQEPRPQIPFFSKVAFRQFAKTLSNMGYNVLIGNIHAKKK